MIRLLRVRHPCAVHRLGAVRAHPGAARALECQAGAGPCNLSSSWGLMTAQATRASHDLPRPRRGRSATSAPEQTASGSQGLTEYDSVLFRLTSVEGEGLNRQELKDMAHSPALGAFQASHVTAWLERYIALDDEAAPPQKEVWGVLSLEGLTVMGRALEILDGQRTTTQATRARSGGAAAQAAGVESFDPSLASRLVCALGRGRYTWYGGGLEELNRLVSLLLPVVIGEGGKGLRKLTAQELARLPGGIAIPGVRQVVDGVGPTASHKSRFSDEMVLVEAECLRRGLDKFKPADLANLLEGFGKRSHAVGKELMEAVRERMIRRGYLTSGRGGKTDPRDVLRLLQALSLGPKTAEPVFVSSIISEVLVRKGVVDSWQPADVLHVLCRVIMTRDCEAHSHVLRRLVAREEEWAGRSGVDHHAIHQFYICMHLLRAEARPQEALDLLGRLTLKWAAEVEAGECVLHAPLDYLLRLRTCLTTRALDGKDKAHAAQVLMRGLVDRLHLDAYSFLTRPMYITDVLQVFRSVDDYPGHDVIDGLIDRLRALASVGPIEPGRLHTLSHVLIWAMKRHEYTPPPGFPTMVLEWCRNARLRNVPEVVHLAKLVERLYGSLLPKAPPEAYPSQAVVDALLHHIGDPAELMERIGIHEGSPQSASLEAAVELLKRNKPMTPSTLHHEDDRGAEDGHKEAKQPDGAGLGRGGRDDKAMVEALWTRVKGAQMGRGPDQSLDQPSPVTHALSTADVAMLLKGLACGDLDVTAEGKDEIGAACASAMVREGVQPGRLEAMDNGTLLAWLQCLLHVRDALDVQERRAVMDAWEEEFNMRGLPQVVTRPEELVGLLYALTHLRVELNDALLLSILAEVDRLGVQSFTPNAITALLYCVSLLPGTPKYMEQVLGTLQATPPQDLDACRLLAIFVSLAPHRLRLRDTYLEHVMAALEAKGLSEVPLQQLAGSVRRLQMAKTPPFEHVLRALQHAVSHGHPDGILAPLPEDEGERDALRAQTLQGLPLSNLWSMMRVCSMKKGQCDFSVQERMLRAYLTGLEEWTEGDKGKRVVRRSPSRALPVGSSRADVVKELVGWWWALLHATYGGIEQPAGQAMRLHFLQRAYPYLTSLASQAGLSQTQMVQANSLLLDCLEIILERDSGNWQYRGENMRHAVWLLRCLEQASMAVRRRESMVTLWEWSLTLGFPFKSGFRWMDRTAPVALVRGAAAHDFHPGTEALQRFVALIPRHHLRAQVDAAALEMEQRAAQGKPVSKGGEGAGCGAEGRRFLRELRELLQGGSQA